MPSTSGYSGTPLAKKLGIKEGFSMLLYHSPEYYFNLFADLPENLSIHKTLVDKEFDFVHVFCTSIQELEEIAGKHKNCLKQNGMLWVSWPKGSSSIKTDLKREPVREHLLSIGLVDTKVAAIDEDWSGLKFVYRLKDRT